MLNEIKESDSSDQLGRKQFMYANVLVGLSLLLQERQRSRKPIENGNGETGPRPIAIEDQVETTCRALAPFMLALTSLGEADLGEQEGVEGLEETA